MSEFRINDYILNKEAKRLAAAALLEAVTHGGDAEDLLDQLVNDHEWIIYDYKAMLLCAECDTIGGQIWIDHSDWEPTNNIRTLARRTAYATLLMAATNYLKV